MAVLKPLNPSIATTSTASHQACGRSLNQVLKACLERPSTMSNNLAGRVPSRIPVRSMITVTYLSSRRVWRHTCWSTPRTRTPSNRVASSIRIRLPSARTVRQLAVRARLRSGAQARGCVSAHVVRYATLAAAAGHFVSYGLYRWEVAARETVIVGLVGAGGLGRLLQEQRAGFDLSALATTVIPLIAVSMLVDGGVGVRPDVLLSAW